MKKCCCVSRALHHCVMDAGVPFVDLQAQLSLRIGEHDESWAGQKYLHSVASATGGRVGTCCCLLVPLVVVISFLYPNRIYLLLVLLAAIAVTCGTAIFFQMLILGLKKRKMKSAVDKLSLAVLQFDDRLLSSFRLISASQALSMGLQLSVPMPPVSRLESFRGNCLLSLPSLRIAIANAILVLCRHTEYAVYVLRAAGYWYEHDVNVENISSRDFGGIWSTAGSVPKLERMKQIHLAHRILTKRALYVLGRAATMPSHRMRLLPWVDLEPSSAAVLQVIDHLMHLYKSAQPHLDLLINSSPLGLSEHVSKSLATEFDDLRLLAESSFVQAYHAQLIVRSLHHDSSKLYTTVKEIQRASEAQYKCSTHLLANMEANVEAEIPLLPTSSVPSEKQSDADAPVADISKLMSALRPRNVASAEENLYYIAEEKTSVTQPRCEESEDCECIVFQGSDDEEGEDVELSDGQGIMSASPLVSELHTALKSRKNSTVRLRKRIASSS
jgi:hypothetical protein